MNEIIIKKEFSKQAHDFSNKQLTMNNESYLSWMLKYLHLKGNFHVLDVAAGTGILSRAMSPYVEKVTAVDISEDMMREGQLQNELLDIKNVEFNLGNVEKIDFKNNTFDLVISRFAFHHFLDPEKVLNEMYRVSKSTVSIIDMISSEDSHTSKLYNLHEKLRDPSHTLALKETDFLQMFKQAGMEITHSEIIEVDINVTQWLNLAKTNKDISGKIINRIHNEIRSGELTTGLYPFKRNNELFFKQRWLQIIGNK